MPQEFPKWVYPDGTAASGVLVRDAAQEIAAMPRTPSPQADARQDDQGAGIAWRSDGYAPIRISTYADTPEPADAPKRRGRPPKAYP